MERIKWFPYDGFIDLLLPESNLNLGYITNLNAHYIDRKNSKLPLCACLWMGKMV